MNLAILNSRASCGIQAPLVRVETHIANGLPKFLIVGLPDTEVRESRERVRSAILNAQFYFPSRRITVNLAPADLPKEGGRFDLAIALGILLASGQLHCDNIEEYEFAGELALSGELRAIHGALPFAVAMREQQRKLIISQGNADEAALVHDINVFPANHLIEVVNHLSANKSLSRQTPTDLPQPQTHHCDMQDVHGQSQAKRALEIAAAGGHSLLLVGPPGTGKTMLASRLPSILPPMRISETLQTAAIASISRQGFVSHSWQQRPFRAPHHTASSVALVGGGSTPRPGEISLAHNGVLFLDELPEFKRAALETLREPLESGMITISRAARQAEFPARFQLIAAMNPCPCGESGDPQGNCRCTSEQIQRYQQRLSGPLLDRIDMQIEVARSQESLFQQKRQQKSDNSAAIQQRVVNARQQQLRRAQKINAHLSSQELEFYCQLNLANEQFLESALEKLRLSNRALHRILRVARTIADLSAADTINQTHLSEALSYRYLDRRNKYLK